MTRYVCFLFVVFSQIISGFILPLTKPSGDPDLSSIISHITLMESSMSKLETQAQASHDQLILVKAELKTAQEKLRSAEADIITLQNDKILRPTAAELTTMKSDIANLKSSKPQHPNVNLTIVDVMSRDLKTNTAAIQVLRSKVDANIVDINNTRVDGEVNELQQKKLRDEVTHFSTDVNNTRNVAKTIMAELQTLKTQQNNVESNTTRQAVSTLESLAMLTHVEVHKALVSIHALELHVKANLSTAVRELVSAQLSTQLPGLLSSQLPGPLSSLQHNLENQIDQANTDVAFQVTNSGYTRDWTKLYFDTVDFNQGGGYNSTSGYFTAPVSGTYLFWCNILIYHSKGRIYIYKGSTSIAQGLTYTADNQVAMTVVTHMDKGEQVHFTAGSSSISINGGESHYGGALLHASKLHI